MKNIEYSDIQNFSFEKKKYFYYFIFGNNKFLTYECKQHILKKYKKYYFTKKLCISYKQTKDLDKVLEKLQEDDFFNKVKIIMIDIHVYSYSHKEHEKIKKIFCYINKNNILIAYSSISNIGIKNIWIQDKDQINGIIINCNTFNQVKTLKWLDYIAKKNEKIITKTAKNFLYYAYKGNLLFLKKHLEIIFLVYFQKQQKITYFNLKKITQENIESNAFEWIDCLFKGNKIDSFNLLKKLNNNNFYPLYIIRNLQKDLLILFEMKQKNIINSNFLLQKKIWKIRHQEFFRVLKHNDINNLLKIINLLYIAEISEKRNKKKYTWDALQRIILYLN
ncbi:DNA polymerase III subunit delta [Buchnera aphidicola (Thelaxes suberi)]|uniref:DNA polymerase III subunit delta n=1 Tax=Buchnera aphidicola TaxID=9 RepID=UPI003464E80F